MLLFCFVLQERFLSKTLQVTASCTLNNRNSQEGMGGHRFFFFFFLNLSLFHNIIFSIWYFLSGLSLSPHLFPFPFFHFNFHYMASLSAFPSMLSFFVTLFPFTQIIAGAMYPHGNSFLTHPGSLIAISTNDLFLCWTFLLLIVPLNVVHPHTRVKLMKDILKHSLDENLQPHLVFFAEILSVYSTHHLNAREASHNRVCWTEVMYRSVSGPLLTNKNHRKNTALNCVWPFWSDEW